MGSDVIKSRSTCVKIVQITIKFLLVQQDQNLQGVFEEVVSFPEHVHVKERTRLPDHTAHVWSFSFTSGLKDMTARLLQKASGGEPGKR